ncbi:MAG: divalent-cation tolerance protein CutA [Acidobacteriota bacterium]|nr:divalent-cation tolerance protein CutA [Acidobacteriota bacterium]
MDSIKASEAIVVFVTTANSEEAAQLAEMLVGQRLAACVQILPEMESVYRWQGKIERQKEVLVIAKTTKSKFEELEAKVRAIHSYETPEIIALPLTAGSPPYLEWLNSSVNADEEGP